MVLEPIAQIVVRPDNAIGSQNSLVNIDSQSLVFDDTNLFDWSRYSGYDRFETGTRLNYGGQFTMNFRNGGFLNVMAGQSYQLAGKNSYATPDAANIGLSSGLDTRVSDYVGRVSFSPSSMFSFTAKGRFDPETFKPRRIDLIASANLSNDLTASLQYASYEGQPAIGYAVRRQGASLNSKYNITKNYFVNGNVIFDLSRHFYNGTTGTARYSPSLESASAAAIRTIAPCSPSITPRSIKAARAAAIRRSWSACSCAHSVTRSSRRRSPTFPSPTASRRSDARECRALPLALTQGDPSGIGPEIAIKAWRAMHTRRDAVHRAGRSRAFRTRVAGAWSRRADRA